MYPASSARENGHFTQECQEKLFQFKKYLNYCTWWQRQQQAMCPHYTRPRARRITSPALCPVCCSCLHLSGALDSLVLRRQSTGHLCRRIPCWRHAAPQAMFVARWDYLGPQSPRKRSRSYDSGPWSYRVLQPNDLLPPMPGCHRFGAALRVQLPRPIDVLSAR